MAQPKQRPRLPDRDAELLAQLARQARSPGVSPGSSLPPGNSQAPARCLPGRPLRDQHAPAPSISTAGDDVDRRARRVALGPNRSLAAGRRGSACTSCPSRRDTARCARPWAPRARRASAAGRGGGRLGAGGGCIAVAAGPRGQRSRLNRRDRLGVLQLQRARQALLPLELLALDLRLAAHLDLRHRRHGVELDPIEHGGEQLERLALVLLLRSSSARSCAGKCPGACSPWPPDARASADRACAASPPSRCSA